MFGFELPPLPLRGRLLIEKVRGNVKRSRVVIGVIWPSTISVANLFRLQEFVGFVFEGDAGIVVVVFGAELKMGRRSKYEEALITQTH